MNKLTLAVLTLVVITLCGCQPSSSVIRLGQEAEKNPTPIQQTIVFDSSNTITVGNNSWVAINIFDTPAKDATLILEILDKFEKTHPELIVLDWKIEKNQDTHGTSAYIFGLWIHHKPKQ